MFQDATRLEVEFVTSVGIGDLDGPEPAGEQRVRVAAGRAGLDETVDEWPGGLHARLGRRFPDGVGLSGGQWQKVAHARSTLRESPALLILDEPTAALDAQSEHNLFQRVRQHAGVDTITVMVSHRFSTVRDADLIVVLDRGRIIERGSHAELLALGGHYAAMYQRQARHYR
jgi:ATP-binding cassette subfamily B protein